MFGGEEEGVEEGEGGPSEEGETKAWMEWPEVDVEGTMLAGGLNRGVFWKFRGEIGGVGRFVCSRTLVWPSDNPLSCKARSRSAIEPPGGAALFSLQRVHLWQSSDLRKMDNSHRLCPFDCFQLLLHCIRTGTNIAAIALEFLPASESS